MNRGHNAEYKSKWYGIYRKIQDIRLEKCRRCCTGFRRSLVPSSIPFFSFFIYFRPFTISTRRLADTRRVSSIKAAEELCPGPKFAVRCWKSPEPSPLPLCFHILTPFPLFFIVSDTPRNPTKTVFRTTVHFNFSSTYKICKFKYFEIFTRLLRNILNVLFVYFHPRNTRYSEGKARRWMCKTTEKLRLDPRIPIRF